jgi:hypothetical protein
MPSNRVLDVGTLEGWLWEAACQIRGPLDAPKFKDDILPLIFRAHMSTAGVGRTSEQSSPEIRVSYRLSA